MYTTRRTFEPTAPRGFDMVRRTPPVDELFVVVNGATDDEPMLPQPASSAADAITEKNLWSRLFATVQALALMKKSADFGPQTVLASSLRPPPEIAVKILELLSTAIPVKRAGSIPATIAACLVNEH
jgi:hypothetical protein